VGIRYRLWQVSVAWALIWPFLTIIIFTVIFGKVAKLPIEDTAPYALMVFAGVLP
jgi:lipopolysaccharide transport system permease protein